ncbi:hypothetical protein BYT27DRAFT_7220759 [Phlegmacium glaucopus]|nr:hypothetical protein BYT27DRAFT_7220759 [Phlegmacium glaucopus]
MSPPSRFRPKFADNLTNSSSAFSAAGTGGRDNFLQPNLTPLVSELRPHCSACDQLRSTLLADGLGLEITDADLDRLVNVINTSWQPTTREMYGAGLLVFHVFCDQRAVPEPLRCPADPLLMLTFIASCAGSYSGKTLANYFYAVRAWHTLHGAPWRMNAAEMKAALDADKLDLSKPLDAAVYACLTTTFYSAARLGEFTVASLKAFDPRLHIKVSDTTPTGEDVYWAAQHRPSDPQAALTNHFNINNPSPDKALFAWRHPQGLRPLTRAEFLKSINTAATELGIMSLKGHEYLLRGVPFDVVKSIGRWSSEAFVLYLRQHAVIIAPYIQGTPVMDAFTRYTMPPPR